MSRQTVLLLVAVVALAVAAVALLRGKARFQSFSDSAPDALFAAAGKELPRSTLASGGEMVLIPAGEYVMGDARGRADETPHTVSVGAFYLDRCLVTQELYAKVLGKNPSKWKGAQNPVEQVQWEDTARFCNKCSELDGLTPCYNLKAGECNFAANGYRLPTEAEWEYACRAGSAARYCFGNDERQLPQYAWFKPNSNRATHPVGQKSSNRWGLFDMHGNVWEWCNDFYAEDYYKQSPTANPRGPAGGKLKVVRGGAYDLSADSCRAAHRSKETAAYVDDCLGYDVYGFRRVRSATGPATTQVAATAPPAPAAPEAKPKSEPAAPVVPADAGKLDLSRLKGTIAFVSDRAGALAIWRMHASGRNARQLTQDPEPDADPRFSPDGRRIVYTSLRGGSPEVWVMGRDGSAPQRLAPGSQPDWSPDGQALVFVRDKQVWVRNLASGQEKRVTPESWERCGVPAWSPDGKRIALASRHLGTIGVFILGLDGKENFQLRTQEPACTPRWSKDGSRLLCQSVKGHVHQVGVDGANWEQVTFGADVQHEGRYSPDGSLLLFCRAATPEGPWQICVRKLDGDELDFTPLTAEGSNLSPDWHPSEDQ